LPKTLHSRTILFFAAIGQIVLLGACGSWSPEKLEGATALAIDGRLPEQMPIADFRAEFPQAVRVDGDEMNGSWLVLARQVCFWCRTAWGFQRSEDVYARVVRFENGRLATIEAARLNP